MKIKRIDSASNSLFKDLQQLLNSKGINKQKRALVYGEKILQEKIENIGPSDFFIFHSEQHPLFLLAPDAQVLVLKKDLFEALDVVGTHAPILSVSTPALKNWEKSQVENPEHEILCALGDPSNLGAVIRSAYAFGFRKMILLNEAANPYLPKVTKAASGYNLNMTFEKGPSITELQDVSQLVALDMDGESIHNWNFKTPQRWLIGEEGPGVPQNLHCQKLSIPMENNVESLNAAITASLLFYEIHSQRK